MANIGKETREVTTSFMPEETQFCSGTGEDEKEVKEFATNEREVPAGTRLMYLRHSGDFTCIWYQLPPDHEYPGLTAYVRISVVDIHVFTKKV